MGIARLVSLLLGIGVVALIGWAIFGGGDARVAKHEAIFTKPLSPSQPTPDAAPPEAKTATPEEADHALDASADKKNRILLAGEKAEAERLAALEGKNAAPPAKPKTTLYYRVTVRDGGTLESAGVVIRLDGIVVREANAVCPDKDGKKWACGAAARAALARLVRARAVSCTAPPGGKVKQGFTARCSVGSTDLSTWMVRQGWAKPKEPTEPALADAARAAQSERIGLWRSAE